MIQGDKKTGNPNVFAVLAASGQIKIFQIVANENSVRMQEIKELAKGDTPFTFVLDDPLSNCFIYNPNAPQDDP